MLSTARRKLYRSVRFKTWFRKTNYYHRKIRGIDQVIARFRTPEQLCDREYVRQLKRDMVRCLLKYGAYFDEYFLFDFEGKDDAYRASFITEGIRMSFYPRMNTPSGHLLSGGQVRHLQEVQGLFRPGDAVSPGPPGDLLSGAGGVYPLCFLP
jgi:hypothetical protein